MCFIACTPPSPKSHIYWPCPLPLWGSFSEYLRLFSSFYPKYNLTHNSHVVQFFLSQHFQLEQAGGESHNQGTGEWEKTWESQQRIYKSVHKDYPSLWLISENPTHIGCLQQYKQNCRPFVGMTEFAGLVSPSWLSAKTITPSLFEGIQQNPESPQYNIHNSRI